MSPVKRHTPGTADLLAASCGTAIASVCALGLFQMEQLLGGVWSVLAVLAGGACCYLLARACARLTAVLPGGAGLLAFLGRGLGRPAALLLALPYLLLTLVLAGVEATIAGIVLQRITGLPVAVGSAGFLVGTWAVCRAGLRPGYALQSAATWALLAGMVLSSLALVGMAGWRGELGLRLLPHAPDVGRFVAGVGQALFLFMGFELVTSQADVAGDHQAVGRALRGSVLILAGFYATVSLGFSCLDRPRQLAALLAPQLTVAEQAGGEVGCLLVAGLSLLASLTSFNGALLTVSRLLAALASQGALPRGLARIDPRSLAPRPALLTLLLVSLTSAALVQWSGAARPVILAGAVSAALVYAALAWVRERSPFSEQARPWYRSAGSAALAAWLAALAGGVLLDAGADLPGALLLLGAAVGAALFVTLRSGRVRARSLVPGREGAHAG